jgi:hypothetical protein
MRRNRLYEGRVRPRHRRAAFLAVLLAVRPARHGTADLHNLVGRRHNSAIDCVHSNREGNSNEHNRLQKLIHTKRCEAER